MFIGEFKHTIDGKGRLIMPAKFRAALQTEGVVVTPGFEKCLLVYPREAWINFVQSTRTGQSLFSSDARLVTRMLSRGSEETLDRQGRLFVVPTLRDHAALDRDVVVVGCFEYLEIWSKDHWEKYLSQAEQAFEEKAEKLVSGPPGVGIAPSS